MIMRAVLNYDIITKVKIDLSHHVLMYNGFEVNTEVKITISLLNL